MAKKYESTERFLKPDPQFQSRLLAKFINCVMKQGKKTAARKICYDALKTVATKLPEQKADEVFTTAVNNLKPIVEVRSKRVGGATYQVPMEVKKNRQQTLAFRWLLEVTRAKSGKPMSVRLADEIMAAFKNEGAAVTIRENTHKMAEANRMNAHLAW